MSEKPNLLKLTKSNIFVMHKKVTSQLFELPKIRHFIMASRYVYLCKNSYSKRFICKGMLKKDSKQKKANYDLGVGPDEK